MITTFKGLNQSLYPVLRCAAILLAFTSPSPGAQSIQWGTSRGSVELSNVNALNSLQTFLIEFHVHTLTPPPAPAFFFTNGTVDCSLTPELSMLCGFNDVSGTQVGGSITRLAGRTDVRVRIQIPTGKDQISIETWNGDFSGYTLQYTSTMPSLTGKRFNFARFASLAGAPWQNTFLTAQMAFFRIRTMSTSVGGVAPNSSMSRLVGDVIDYSFEGNLADGSGRNRTLAIDNGSAAYVATPGYGIAASIVMPGGTVGVLDAPLPLSVVASSDNDITSISWESVAGPYGMTFTDKVSSLTAATFWVGGTYTVRVSVVTSNGLSTTQTKTFGVVATGRNSTTFVPIDHPGMEFLLGPVTRTGTSPWPWYDTTEKSVADRLGPIIPDEPAGYPANGQGTISIPLNGTTVTGRGTSFLTTFKCNNTDWIMVHYPVINGKTGLRPLNVLSCSSDTQMQVGVFHGENVLARDGVVSDVSYSRFTDLGFWANGSNNINYYDNVAAYYRLYYRTGDETYRSYARRLADSYWRYPLDEGRSCTPNVRGQCSPTRVWALSGIMARAVDERPDMWPGIVGLVNDCFRSIEAKYDINATNDWDPREDGYCTLFMTQLAAVHPDENVRAASLARAQNAARRLWRVRQSRDGSWRVTQYDQSWQGAGTQPWTLAYALYALVNLHYLTGDEAYVQDFLRGLDFIWDYGLLKSCRGLMYSTHFSRIDGLPAPTCTSLRNDSYYCHTSDSPPHCSAPFDDGARTLAADVIAAFGYAYALTGNVDYRNRGDELFSAAYGKDGGPGADGGKNQFDTVLTGGTSFLGKQFGMNAGAGRASTYLALRNDEPMGRQPETVSIDVDLSSQPSAIAVRYTVVYPSSYSVQVTCTQRPCVVTIDGRHVGRYQLITEYLDSNGNTITSDADRPAKLKI